MHCAIKKNEHISYFQNQKGFLKKRFKSMQSSVSNIKFKDDENEKKWQRFNTNKVKAYVSKFVSVVRKSCFSKSKSKTYSKDKSTKPSFSKPQQIWRIKYKLVDPSRTFLNERNDLAYLEVKYINFHCIPKSTMV